MGSVVPILKGPKGQRTLEGYAEMKEVLNYLGNGIYFVACVFIEDRKQEITHRLYNIDEVVPENIKKESLNV